jgi:hypothetical protein
MDKHLVCGDWCEAAETERIRSWQEAGFRRREVSTQGTERAEGVGVAANGSGNTR